MELSQIAETALTLAGSFVAAWVAIANKLTKQEVLMQNVIEKLDKAEKELDEIRKSLEDMRERLTITETLNRKKAI